MTQKVANMAPTCAQVGLSLGVSSAILDSLGTVLFSITVFTKFLVPGGPETEGSAAEATYLWGYGKTRHRQLDEGFHYGKTTYRQSAVFQGQ